MPIRWYGPANPEDPTYRHFERIVNLCLHGGVFAAVNSGSWFLQETVSYTHLTLPFLIDERSDIRIRLSQISVDGASRNLAHEMSVKL